MAVVQEPHSPSSPSFGGVWDEDPWGAFGNPSLLHSCLHPAQATRALGDRVRTSPEPQAEPTPWQVLSASTLHFFPPINPAGEKTILEAKLA